MPSQPRGSWSGLLTVNWLGPFLLTVEIRFGLLCFRWKIGLVFLFFLAVAPIQKFGFGPFACGSPRPEIGFGLFLRTGSPTVSTKDEP